MTAVETPCETSPEDWFIESNGLQYRDDEILSEAEVRGLTRSVIPLAGETDEDHAERVTKTLRTAERERIRQALIRRRKAREACYECPLRLRCLGLGVMPDNLEYGTWGGYYAEERQEIDRLRQERAASRGE